MVQTKLMAGTNWLSQSDLKNGNAPANITEYEKNAVQFCQQWLNGKNEFEFLTSGSTGNPKQITFRRDQLEASARLTERALTLEPGYNALICLDTNFIAGAMMLVRSMVTGMNMILRTPSANPLLEIHEQIDFAAFVPYQIISILEQSPSALDKLKKVIIGGATLKNEVINLLQNKSASFYATYGMTETITHVALQKLNGPHRQDFFQLLPGITTATDNRGCLTLHVPHLGNKSIVTNDLVTLFDENKFRWLGRYDLVINSGGVKVQAEKIEGVIDTIFHKLKIHKTFFVNGIPDEKLGEQVVLFLEGSKLSLAQEEAVKVMLDQHLSVYEIPKSICYINRFNLTPTQKIDRVSTMKIYNE